MKLGTIGTILLCALGGLAQSVRIVEPTQNTRIVAGESFTATVALTREHLGCLAATVYELTCHLLPEATTSSVDVLALLFGAKLVNPQEPETVELGQTQLATVVAPTFPIHGEFIEQNVTLTFPVDLITGLDKNYNLTCGEFYTLGVRISCLLLDNDIFI